MRVRVVARLEAGRARLAQRLQRGIAVRVAGARVRELAAGPGAERRGPRGRRPPAQRWRRAPHVGEPPVPGALARWRHRRGVGGGGQLMVRRLVRAEAARRCVGGEAVGARCPGLGSGGAARRAGLGVARPVEQAVRRAAGAARRAAVVAAAERWRTRRPRVGARLRLGGAVRRLDEERDARTGADGGRGAGGGDGGGARVRGADRRAGRPRATSAVHTRTAATRRQVVVAIVVAVVVIVIVVVRHRPQVAVAMTHRLPAMRTERRDATRRRRHQTEDVEGRPATHARRLELPIPTEERG